MMSRDYKPNAERAKRTNKGSPFLSGLLIGFLLGIAASLAVVLFIKGTDSPFTEQAKPAKPISEKIAEDKLSINHDSTSVEDKTSFDFYNILPNSERKISNNETQAEPAVENTYFLQVGAFQTEEEADNMKATLALQGFEALVQTATIPNKGIWHRVRVGPLKTLDEINKTKTYLIDNGFNADLITVNNEN
jgi:cell division protein FtsN